MPIIKIEIQPSFIASCYLLLEQKEEKWQFTFFKKAFSYNSEAEKHYTIELSNNQEVGVIYRLTERVINEAKIDNRFCLDGVGVVCSISNGGIIRSYKFVSPESQTPEIMLMKAVLELSEKYISGEAALINYIELLEGYFTSKLPIKVYEGLPLRVRFYGSLTTHQREALIPFVEKLSQYDSILIDMTNFQGMGTLLYECFKPLTEVKNLNFIANEEGKRHLIAMGFIAPDA